VADSVAKRVLVLYESSSRGAAAIEQAAEAAAQAHASLTVVVVAVTEREDAGCCDTRAGYWNGVVRELASADLRRARSLLGDATGAEFTVVTERSELAALALEIERSRADVVVVPSGRGVHPWFRSRRARRLQRRATGAVVVASGVVPTSL
jgi:nucleotide-binding universal stress UspA family protein